MKTSHSLAAMDGFMGAGATGGSSSAKKTYKITDASNLLNPKAAGTRLKSAAQGVHQRAQRSQTLMRGSVTKPAIAKAKLIVNSSKLQSKTRSANTDRQRVFRSQTINKSAKVRRFGYVAAKESPKSPAAVQLSTIKPPELKISASAKTSNAIALYKPLPSMLNNTSNIQLERMLDEALLKADAHKKTLAGSSSNLWQKIKFAPRWLSIGVAAFAVILLGGYLAVHKFPQVAMRIVSIRAHMDAEVPGYTAAGFSFTQPIVYSTGSVTVNFKANDHSNRAYSITQMTSNMDNAALSASVVPKNTQVQTSTVEGTTVYIYGSANNAAWVNHGMEYKINDSANLNSDQLLKIASSL